MLAAAGGQRCTPAKTAARSTPSKTGLGMRLSSVHGIVRLMPGDSRKPPRLGQKKSREQSRRGSCRGATTFGRSVASVFCAKLQSLAARGTTGLQICATVATSQSGCVPTAAGRLQSTLRSALNAKSDACVHQDVLREKERGERTATRELTGGGAGNTVPLTLQSRSWMFFRETGGDASSAASSFYEGTKRSSARTRHTHDARRLTTSCPCAKEPTLPAIALRICRHAVGIATH